MTSGIRGGSRADHQLDTEAGELVLRNSVFLRFLFRRRARRDSAVSDATATREDLPICRPDGDRLATGLLPVRWITHVVTSDYPDRVVEPLPDDWSTATGLGDDSNAVSPPPVSSRH